MKLLFDQNLSPSLVARLQDLFPGTTHVRNVRLDRAPDHVIWDFACKEGFTIVTQDADFSDRVVLDGFPPKVLWLRAGNRTTTQIEALFRRNSDAIADFDKSLDAGVLVIRE